MIFKGNNKVELATRLIGLRRGKNGNTVTVNFSKEWFDFSNKYFLYILSKHRSLTIWEDEIKKNEKLFKKENFDTVPFWLFSKHHNFQSS